MSCACRLRGLRAFTLVELLVVILVLGVLLAIALPALLKSQNAAKDAQAKSGLNAAYKGLKTYSASHEADFPTGSAELLASIEEAQPGLSGNIVICDGATASKVQLAQKSGSGTTWLMTAERGASPAYAIEQGECVGGGTGTVGYVVAGNGGPSVFYGLDLSAPTPVAIWNNTEQSPQFSGDGSTMSWITSVSAGAAHLTIAKTDGSTSRSVTLDPCRNLSYVATELTFNGDTLHARCSYYLGGYDYYYAVDTATGAVSEWANPVTVNGTTPGSIDSLPLSPDGTQRASAGAHGYGVRLREADGANPTTILPRATAPGWSSYEDSPRWSPDGSKIAFVSDREHPNVRLREVYIINADGTGLTHLHGAEVWDNTAPVWSPDGTYVAYLGADGDMYYTRIDGAGPQTLFKDLGSFGYPATWTN